MRWIALFTDTPDMLAIRAERAMALVENDP